MYGVRYELPLFFTNPLERAVIGDLKLLQIEISRRFRAESHRLIGVDTSRYIAVPIIWLPDGYQKSHPRGVTKAF